MAQQVRAREISLLEVGVHDRQVLIYFQCFSQWQVSLNDVGYISPKLLKRYYHEELFNGHAMFWMMSYSPKTSFFVNICHFYLNVCIICAFSFSDSIARR